MSENSKHSRLPTRNSIYYPVFLDISEKPCLVVGGGKVAERKVNMLLKFGGTVNVVSPRVSSGIKNLAAKGKIHLTEKEYDSGDLEGVALVFAATNGERINQKIHLDARQRNIPVNVVDNPFLCDFIVPSVVKKDPIVVAISTSGMLPFLAKRLRKDIAGHITRDYARYARIVGRLRRLIITTVKDRQERQNLMRQIASHDMGEINGMGFSKAKDIFLGSKR